MQGRHLDQGIVLEEARLPIVAVVVEQVLVQAGPQDIVPHHIEMRLEVEAAGRDPDLDGAGMADTGELLVESRCVLIPGSQKPNTTSISLALPGKVMSTPVPSDGEQRMTS